MSRYINPYTDFGFKRLFGEEANKDLLIDFLNTFLPEKHRIKTLNFRNTEQLGPIALDRKAVFDIFCEAESGEKFIVEMQKAKQHFFKDRSLFCTAFPIREQAFATAEIARMSRQEHQRYEADRMVYWTNNAAFHTAITEGEEKIKIEIARNMKKEGFDVSMILKMTGLSQKEIKRLD